MHIGLFYVIDGILDISLPPDEVADSKNGREEAEHKHSPNVHTATMTPGVSSVKQGSIRRNSASTSERPANKKPPGEKRRHLFTVKPGGIAGYMGS